MKESGFLRKKKQTEMGLFRFLERDPGIGSTHSSGAPLMRGKRGRGGSGVRRKKERKIDGYIFFSKGIPSEATRTRTLVVTRQM